jgi:hypothetical protein
MPGCKDGDCIIKLVLVDEITFETLLPPINIVARQDTGLHDGKLTPLMLSVSLPN